MSKVFEYLSVCGGGKYVCFSFFFYFISWFRVLFEKSFIYNKDRVVVGYR